VGPIQMCGKNFCLLLILLGFPKALILTPPRLTQGDLKTTDDPLDLAIQGKGFFRVCLPDGRKAYTRIGIFNRDSQGRLVTADGLLLDPLVQLDLLQTVEILITQDGAVLVKKPGEIEFTKQGQIQLAYFLNLRGLRYIGRGLYIPDKVAGDELLGRPGGNGLGIIQSEMLEMSNTNITGNLCRWLGIITRFL